MGKSTALARIPYDTPVTGVLPRLMRWLKSAALDRKVIQAFAQMRLGLPFRSHLTDITNVHRWMQSWAWICADRNAVAVGQQPLRLYNAGGKTLRRTRKLDKATRTWLRKSSVGRFTDSTVEVEEHPFLNVVRKPNPILDGFSLMWMTTHHLQFSGAAYWHLHELPDGGVGEIWPLPPQHTFPIVGAERMFDSYQLRVGGVIKEFPASEIVHFRRPSPLDTLSHMGFLRGVLETCETNIRMLEYTRALYENFGVPDILISAKGETTPSQLEQLEQEWKERYGGWTKRGEPAVSPVEVEVQKLGLNMRDLQFKDELINIRDEIAAGFGVPMPVIRSDGSTFSNLKNGVILWNRGTVTPLCTLISETLNLHVMPRYTPREGERIGGVPVPDPWFVAFDEPTIDNPDDEVERLGKLVDRGILTINQALEELDREPVPWGEQPFLSAGLRTPEQLAAESTAQLATTEAQVLSMAATSQPTVQEAAPPSFGELSTLYHTMVSMADLDGANLLRAAIAGRLGGALPQLNEIRPGSGGGVVNPEEAADADEDEAQPGEEGQGPQGEEEEGENDEEGAGKAAQQACIDTVRLAAHFKGRYEKLRQDMLDAAQSDKGFAAAVAGFLEKVQGHIDANLAAAIDEARKTGTLPPLFDVDALTAEFVEMTQGSLVPAIVEGSQAAAIELGHVGLQATLLEPKRVSELAASFAEKVGHEVLDALAVKYRGIVLPLLDEQLPTATIAKTLVEQLALDEMWKGERIARTEINNALNAGAADTYLTAGVVKHAWLASDDACEFCLALDGKQVEIGKPFVKRGEVLRGRKGGTLPVTYKDVVTPTLHPHCVCTTVPVVKQL